MREAFEIQAELNRTASARSGRYFGAVSGTITDTNDSSGLYMVKASFGGQQDTDESYWLIPAFPASIESKPLRGDPCVVMFIDGDPNRGMYFYHPKSTTKNRPNEAMALGTTLAGVVNQVQADLKTLVVAYNGQTYSNGGHPATVTITSDQSLASDGSAVPKKSGSNKVLSGLIKVR